MATRLARLKRGPAAALLMLWGCGEDPSFFRVPRSEAPARGFVVEFVDGRPRVTELLDDTPLYVGRPETRPLWWVSIPLDRLEARLGAAASEPLDWTLAPVGCDGEFPLPDEITGLPIRSLGPRFARLAPGEPAFEPLAASDVGAGSELDRLSIARPTPRRCLPSDRLQYRPFPLGLPANTRLAELFAVSEEVLVALEGERRVAHLVRGTDATLLDRFDVQQRYGFYQLRRALLRGSGPTLELVVAQEDLDENDGLVLGLPIEGDRWGPHRELYTDEVVNWLAEEPEDGALIMVGRRGLVGVLPAGSSTVSVTRLEAAVDLEGISRMSGPFQYLISDGAGRVHWGDLRRPDTLKLRPFTSNGLRDVHWFATAEGGMAYARDHADRVFRDTLEATRLAPPWLEGLELPPELLEACIMETDVCGRARALSPVYRLEAKPASEAQPARLVISFLNCRAAILHEPESGCAFGLAPPGPIADRVRSVVAFRGEHLILMDSGAVYAVDLR